MALALALTVIQATPRLGLTDTVIDMPVSIKVLKLGLLPARVRHVLQVDSHHKSWRYCENLICSYQDGTTKTRAIYEEQRAIHNANYGATWRVG